MSLGNDLKIKSVDLTVSPLPIQVHSQGIIQLLDNDEKDRESERSRVSQEIPIHYHYLTFDTELPSPTTTTSSNRNAPPPPEPDLKQYESPFKWSKTRKTLTTWLLCLVAAASAMSAGIYPAGTAQMQEYWHISEVVNFLGITTFTTGFSVAPMILAPFSEINGRRPVFLVTGIMFVVCTLCCAVTRSFPGMLVARFFTGVGASTFSTMVGGVISDMYHTDDRNTAMCLFAGASLFGTGFGPIVGGAIAQHISWRWMFYVMTIFVGVLVAAVMIFFNETRGSVLLSRKAKALNKWYEEREKSGFVGFEMPISEDGILTTQSQRVRWKVKSDEERESWHKMIGISLYRPFRKSSVSLH
jgi:multidrug resistance protein